MAICGKDLLIETDENDDATFEVLAGMRSKSINFDNQSVETTNTDSARWRELLACGVKSASISGNAVFMDDAKTLLMLQHAGDTANAEIIPARFTIPGVATVSGDFHISSMEVAGEFDGEVTYDVAFESAGALTIAAV